MLSASIHLREFIQLVAEFSGEDYQFDQKGVPIVLCFLAGVSTNLRCQGH